VDQVVREVCGYQCPLVEITGGEPLLQKEVYPLMNRLVGSGLTVLLETSGNIDVGNVNPAVVKIMDFKCPSSGECERNLYTNLDKLQPHDEIKFVIGTRDDYLWTKQILEEHRLTERFPVLLSTVFNQIQPRQVVEWLLEDNLRVRFQLQAHKYIWEPNTKRV
jgi:7-carboxy-7-deazaguanine synthase